MTSGVWPPFLYHKVFSAVVKIGRHWGPRGISIWETFKWGACRRKAKAKTALIQTDGQGIVPLPLAEGVPNRARIVYSLWRAGYDVDVSSYPEDVQEEYFGLVGRHLGLDLTDLISKVLWLNTKCQ